MEMGKISTEKCLKKYINCFTTNSAIMKYIKKGVGNGPAEYIRFHNFDGRIGFISALSHKFCYKCNRIRLTSEGFLKPCLQYGNGTDVQGNVKKRGG